VRHRLGDGFAHADAEILEMIGLPLGRHSDQVLAG
jgi:hypothetical protein